MTRRVYRSGESEYFLNRSSCRLKDVVDLFRDTGIGKEGYSIIGQGRIDEILSRKGVPVRKRRTKNWHAPRRIFPGWMTCWMS